MTDTFKAFLASGELPELAKPITIESLVAALGPPDDTADLEGCLIYKYGAAQFMLDQHGSVDLFVYFWSLPDSWSPIDVQPLSSETTLYELIQMLNDASLWWEINQELSFGEQVTVMTEGGVDFIFGLLAIELDKLGCRLQEAGP